MNMHSELDNLTEAERRAIQFADTANYLRMPGVWEQAKTSVAMSRYATRGAAIRDMQSRALFAQLGD